jgi:hypothetical protein
VGWPSLPQLAARAPSGRRITSRRVRMMARIAARGAEISRGEGAVAGAGRGCRPGGWAGGGASAGARGGRGLLGGSPARAAEHGPAATAGDDGPEWQA